jgi:hypothetical protein
MNTQLAAVPVVDGPRRAGPFHRSIVALDLEGSTTRTNPVRGALRHILYDLLGRALDGAGIADDHLEQFTDRGDGVLVLIRPDDAVPKTVLLGRFMPLLTSLLTAHNNAVTDPALAVRLRAVVHAGEVHGDDRGFYGEDLDAAFRLLDAPRLKKALRNATGSPLILIVSDEIFAGIIRHGYIDGGRYEPCVRIRVADRSYKGWIQIPPTDDSVINAKLRQAKRKLPSLPPTWLQQTG